MRSALLALSLAIGVILLIRVPGRGIDPDELEHIHAACAVSWGEVPYRDFFEHHSPGLYYLLQPILRMAGPEPQALWWSRLLMWVAGMATLAIAGAMAYRLAGRTAAAAAPALLGCTTVFFWKTVEVRPDVPAMLLLTLAAYLVIAPQRRRSNLTALLVGLLLGLATLFTQKAIVPAAAMTLAQVVVSYRGPQTACGFAWDSSKTTIRHSVLMVLGGATAWLIAIGLFYSAGAADAFLQATVYQLWRWPVRQSPLTALRPTILADLPLWLGAAMAIVASIRNGRATTAHADAAETPLYGRSVLSLAVLFCFVCGLFVKAAYAQYYLLWFPLAAVVAADSLVRCGSGAMTLRQRPTFFGVLASLVAFEAALAAHAVYHGTNGSLPHLLDRFSAIGVGMSAAVFVATVATAAGVCILRSRRAGAVLCLAALGLGYAGLRNLDALGWSNRSQVAALATVDRLVGPDETVFDGFTGLGAFRRHAYYYWWLNPYSLSLMGAESQERGLLASLQRSPPKLICVDENVKKLPDVMAWINEKYDPIEPPLYLRKEPLTALAPARGD
jgi:hypothetical protein